MLYFRHPILGNLAYDSSIRVVLCTILHYYLALGPRFSVLIRGCILNKREVPIYLFLSTYTSFYIEVKGVIETGESEALILSGEAVPGVIVGVAVASGLLTSLASVVITALCMRARAKQARPSISTRQPPVPVR